MEAVYFEKSGLFNFILSEWRTSFRTWTIVTFSYKIISPLCRNSSIIRRMIKVWKIGCVRYCSTATTFCRWNENIFILFELICRFESVSSKASSESNERRQNDFSELSIETIQKNRNSSKKENSSLNWRFPSAKIRFRFSFRWVVTFFRIKKHEELFTFFRLN